MDKARKERLEKAGYRVGSAFDVLGVTPEEERLTRLRWALVQYVKSIREKHRKTFMSLIP
jgi:hypothetical protein